MVCEYCGVEFDAPKTENGKDFCPICGKEVNADEK